MATAGRKPKPTAIKKLEGNPGKRPLNEHEPMPPKGEIKCPSWLEPEAKKEWKRLAPSPEAMGVLTTADITAFAGYCQAYARWKEAEEFITQHGSIFQTPSGYVQQAPQVSIAQQNLKIMQSFCSEFGLTPATVVDHIVPHRGNRRLFWDQGNLQPLCATHHNKKTSHGL